MQQDLEKDRKGHGDAKNAIFLQKVSEFFMLPHEKCWGYNRKQSRFKTAPTNITVDLYWKVGRLEVGKIANTAFLPIFLIGFWVLEPRKPFFYT